MAQEISIKINQFKGLRNDENSKQIGNDYFADMSNFNYPVAGVLGVESILCPKFVDTFGQYLDINGIYEFRYLDANNILQTQYIVAIGGYLYSSAYISANINSSIGGLRTSGLVNFATYNDKLFISNGKDNILVYYPTLTLIYGETFYVGYTSATASEMGAPAVQIVNSAGNLTGVYTYAMTYITAGGEEVIGSISNSINFSTQQARLTLPIGYDGTLQRKIYRTKAGGSTYYLLTTITDNTTLTYTDNATDASLPATTIPATNNALPKPYFLTLCNQKLFAGVVDAYPTQIFSTTVNNEVLDSATYIDVANFANDNTAVAGIGNDFDKVIVGTGKNILFINASDYVSDKVVLTRAGVGIKNGYTVKYISAFQGFIGGLTFLSSNNDIRVMSGLQALPVSTSLDNISTDSWSQAIRGSLDKIIKTASNLYAEYYNYQYHLLVDGIRYIYDIRTNGWTYQDVTTSTASSHPKVLGVLNIKYNGNRFPLLFNGQYGTGTTLTPIEQEYGDTKYYHYPETSVDAKEYESYVLSGHINVDTKFSFITKLKFWFLNTENTVNGYRGDGFAFKSLSSGTPEVGNLSGNYKYLMTYLDANGNEVVGGYSNTVSTSTNKVLVYFQNKLIDVTTWKIYRTKGNGSTYYLLSTGTSIGCFKYDNVADASLTVALGATINTYTFSNKPDLNIVVTTDDNTEYTIDKDFNVDDLTVMDYKIVNINRPCRWFTYKLTKKTGNVSFQGIEICGQPLKNKE